MLISAGLSPCTLHTDCPFRIRKNQPSTNKSKRILIFQAGAPRRLSCSKRSYRSLDTLRGNGKLFAEQIFTEDSPHFSTPYPSPLPSGLLPILSQIINQLSQLIAAGVVDLIAEVADRLGPVVGFDHVLQLVFAQHFEGS